MLELGTFYTISEQFYTFFGQLKSSKSITIVNTLVDNIFKYQITLNDKIIFSITLTLYTFNLSTNLQYNNTEFKRLLINSSVSTRSTNDIN